jgi:2-oxo-3-hexenedioate decarboxylase
MQGSWLSNRSPLLFKARLFSNTKRHWLQDHLMAQDMRARRTDEIATEALALLGTGRQVAPFSSRYPAFGLAEAYEVATRVCDKRRARGEHVVGRKIGFTNQTAWSGYGISGPIWSYLFDSTVSDLAAVGGRFDLAGLPEPRIEPEIVLHLASAPHVDMSEGELIGCVDWIAHGFEIVQSIFPGWVFTAADAAAACGVHGGLLLGDRRLISDDRASWGTALTNFTVKLVRDNTCTTHGQASNVLGGPLKALRFLVQELARYPACEPLQPGELVTTGTLTEAMPAITGQSWVTELGGLDIQGLRLRFA